SSSRRGRRGPKRERGTRQRLGPGRGGRSSRGIQVLSNICGLSLQDENRVGRETWGVGGGRREDGGICPSVHASRATPHRGGSLQGRAAATAELYVFVDFSPAGPEKAPDRAASIARTEPGAPSRPRWPGPGRSPTHRDRPRGDRPSPSPCPCGTG